MKAKVRELDGVIKTNFLSNGVPNENMHYTCIACITIDSAMRIDNNKPSAGLFRRMQANTFKYFLVHLKVLMKISSLKNLIHKQLLELFSQITPINSQTLLRLTPNLTLN